MHVLLHDHGQPLVHVIAEILSSVHQMRQPLHQNLQAAVGVYRQYGRQTTRGGRDGLREEARRALHPEEDLVDGTAARVEDYLGDRIHQRPIRQVSVFLLDFADADRHRDVVEHEATVYEEYADRHEATAELRVLHHDRPIAVMPRVHPVTLDVRDASADIATV